MMVRGLGAVIYTSRICIARERGIHKHSNKNLTSTSRSTSVSISEGMVRRTGKGYVLTLVGKPPYEGESGVSTSKGVIFDCEFGGKKGRIVVKCEPENPAKVTKEKL